MEHPVHKLSLSSLKSQDQGAASLWWFAASGWRFSGKCQTSHYIWGSSPPYLYYTPRHSLNYQTSSSSSSLPVVYSPPSVFLFPFPCVLHSSPYPYSSFPFPVFYLFSSSLSLFPSSSPTPHRLSLSSCSSPFVFLFPSPNLSLP